MVDRRDFAWIVPLFLLGPVLLGGCYVPPGAPTPVDYRRAAEPTTGQPYYVYVPSDYTPDREWPLVITLHGLNPWDDYKMQIREWDSLAEEKGLIVVAPKLRAPVSHAVKFAGGWFRDLEADEEFLLALLDQVCGDYRIDRRAVLLTGFSAGGYPMYWVGLRHPERFSMLVARACNSDMKLFERIELSDGAKRLPIRIFWGKDDFGPIRDQSWDAIRFLRTHECYGTEYRKIDGGHLRRPEQAYSMWREVLPPEHQR